MKYKLLILLSYIFYGFIIYILINSITSCKSWEVVQELDINTYHIYNKKKKSVEVISTRKKLEIGKLYKKSSLEILNLDEIDPTIE
tara:strand:- start:256 stop:513 length:258 start_codon:yes stop_codon:yes gene_type:complete